MFRNTKPATALIAMAFFGFQLLATPAAAEELVTYTIEDEFSDVAFAVENAIISKGLVIDSVSHVGDMLERTKEDVGGTKTIFTKADAFLFCSAMVSRAVMEEDPMNIRFCPYPIYVLESPDMPGTVTVAYRAYPEGAMQQVQALLAEIVADALILD